MSSLYEQSMPKIEKMKILGEIVNAGGILNWVLEKNYRVDNRYRTHLLGHHFANELGDLSQAIDRPVEPRIYGSQEDYDQKQKIDGFLRDLEWRGEIGKNIYNKWEKSRREERIKEEEEEAKRYHELNQNKQMKKDTIERLIKSLTPKIIEFLTNDEC